MREKEVKMLSNISMLKYAYRAYVRLKGSPQAYFHNIQNMSFTKAIRNVFMEAATAVLKFSGSSFLEQAGKIITELGLLPSLEVIRPQQ